MISRSTGEAVFQDLRIFPQAVLPPTLKKESRALSIPGWFGHMLGIHHSDRGAFDLEVLSDEKNRVQLLLVAHCHPFYEPKTPGDGERRAFHEGIINSDLAGQREFSWGEVLCRLDVRRNKDWLVVAYAPGPHVIIPSPEVLLQLHEHAPEPSSD